MLKKFFVFTAATLLTLTLWIGVVSFLTTRTISPANIKSWLAESGAYDNVTDAVAAELSKESKEQGEQFSLDDPAIQAAIDEGFSPEFLKSSAEEVIDGFSGWLDGKTDQPEFAIDVGAAKTRFAEAIGQYASDRYDGLPKCKPGEVPAERDILEIPCRVAGYDPQPEIDKAVNEIKNSDEFLPNDTLTYQNLDNGQPASDNLNNLPEAYQRAKLIPVVSLLLALALSAAVIFLSPTIRQGLKRIMGIFYSVGLLLLLQVLLLRLAAEQLNKRLSESAADNPTLQETALALFEQFRGSLQSATLAVAGGFLVVAAGITIYLIITRDKPAKHKANSDHDTPPTEIGSELPKPSEESNSNSEKSIK